MDQANRKGKCLVDTSRQLGDQDKETTFFHDLQSSMKSQIL